VRNDSVPKNIINNAIKLFLKAAISSSAISNRNRFRVLFVKKLLTYILFEKYIFIFQHWKWPARGTGTVPIVSAHFRFPWTLCRWCWRVSVQTVDVSVAAVKGLFTARELNWPATRRPSYTTRSLVTRAGVTTVGLFVSVGCNETRTVSARLVLNACSLMRSLTLQFANWSRGVSEWVRGFV